MPTGRFLSCDRRTAPFNFRTESTDAKSGGHGRQNFCTHAMALTVASPHCWNRIAPAVYQGAITGLNTVSSCKIEKARQPGMLFSFARLAGQS